MKKLLLAGFVVASFILYSFYGRRSSDVAIALPPSLAGNSPAPAGASSPVAGSTSTPSSSTSYKDGQYTGPAEDAYYGYVQVKAVISGGKITDVQFLQFPNEENTSQGINAQAMPYLKQEAIQAQSAQVDTVSGATNTSEAFIQSLSSALSQAHS